MPTYIPIRVGDRTALIEKPEKPGCSHPGCQWPDACKCGYLVLRDGKRVACGAKLCVHHGGGNRGGPGADAPPVDSPSDGQASIWAASGGMLGARAMNRTAYVICWFAIVAGVPTFKGAGIYSENAQSITVDGTTVPMDIFSAHGNDFEEACASARDMCKQYRRLVWLLPHLEKQHG